MSSAPKSEVKLAVCGVTGNGKSTLLNTMMNRAKGTVGVEYFAEGDTPESTTSKPSKKEFTRGNVTYWVTDNPGFLDSGGSNKDNQQLREMVKNNKHAEFNSILYTLPMHGKLNLAEHAVLELMQILFGNEVFNYVIFVLTKSHQVSEARRAQSKDAWRSVLSKALNGAEIRVVPVEKNDPSSVDALFTEIGELVKARPEAFIPRQLSEEIIYQATKKVADKFKVDEKLVFAALTTIITLGAAGGCNIL